MGDIGYMDDIGDIGDNGNIDDIGDVGDACAPCKTENPAKWLFVTPYKSTFNQLVEEVVVIATLECRTLSLCGSHTVLFGLSKQLNLNRKQGH